MAAAVINPISPNPIPTTNFANAIHALTEYLKSTNSKLEKSKLFEADDLIYLLLTLNRMPTEDRTNPHRIPIPKPLHPFVSGSTSICIILDDSPNSSLLPESAREQIKARNLPIDHVIGLWELKSDYKPYESRRKLCHSYDLFFADRKIIPMLPRFLGKHFFKTKKLPLAVDFSRAGWAEQIKSWCESSLMYMGAGTCSALKIGRLGMSEEDILENTLAVIEKAVDYLPKKWGGLRSVHVKTVYSVALPIYQVVPDVGLKIEGVWDEEKKKRLADGKKRERDGEGKKERKVKKGRISDMNLLVEAIGDEIGNEQFDDEVVVGNVDGDEKVEKENDGTSRKVEKGKKRKISAKKVDGLETKEVSKKKKEIKGDKVDVDASEMGMKIRGFEDNKADTEASEMIKKKKKKQNKGEKTKKVGTEDSEMSKKKKQNKGEKTKKVGTEDSEMSKKKTHNKVERTKKVGTEDSEMSKKRKHNKDEKAEFEANEMSKKKKANKGDKAETEAETSMKKQLKEKKAKGCDIGTLKKRKSKKGDEAIDNARAEENVEDKPKDVVRSDLVGKKKKKKTQKDGGVAASVGDELKEEQKEDVCSDLVGKKKKTQKGGGASKKVKSKKSE